jgi:predicted NBD/HSP70 family sugar kinase
MLTCIEAGGSGAQTVRFAGEDAPSILDGVHCDPDATLLLAVPGIIHDGRVTASNLGWFAADPVVELGCPQPAALVMNDAEAAALGESVLRGGVDLVLVTIGTGVGGAVVRDGAVVGGNLFGHAKRFSDQACPCGGVGCLETVAAGWALPTPLPGWAPARMAEALACAIDEERLATPDLVVVSGGLARRYPHVVTELARGLPRRQVEASAAPPGAKSAAAWGLAHAALEAGIAPAGH